MQASKTDIQNLGRLRSRAEFLRLQKAGKRWTARGLAVEIAENDQNMLRFGLTVSKRVSKSAVIRNRIRRRLRAVARDALPLYANSSLDIALIGRTGTATRTHEQLKTDLRWCLEKLGIDTQEGKKPV